MVTSNGSILLDFGYSVANSQIPRFVPELRFLDAILISHGHLDHSGGLPILYRASGYQGPWYGAPSTHETTRMLLTNSSELLKSSFDKSLTRTHHIFKHITNPRNLARIHQNFMPKSLRCLNIINIFPVNVFFSIIDFFMNKSIPCLNCNNTNTVFYSTLD